MTRTAASLLLLGALTTAGGTAMISVPVGVIVAGVLALVGGVLSLDLRTERDEARR